MPTPDLLATDTPDLLATDTPDLLATDTPDLLATPLYKITSDDVRYLRKIAEEVFEPLTRPFRQRRVEPVFSFAKTVRSASRHGDFVPGYDPKTREHRKSKLVIAMSLSGIDRCAAVGLIPLFCELRQFLSFRLFIYTDDVVEAEFTPDGFFANDVDLAWNNVAAPIVFGRLAEVPFDRQEDTLLIIDNLGGGDSAWYPSWDPELRKKVREEQREYLKPGGFGRTNWARFRRELDGHYERIHSSSYARSCKTWQAIVARNTQQRWVEAPAMLDYLVRWLFHPQFGRVPHSEVDWGSPYYVPALRRLKAKFKHLHWLRTIANPEGDSRVEELLGLNVVDYMHGADTIEGFAAVLANIVHGRCTDRLTRERVQFADLIDEPDGPAGEAELEDHVELVAGKEDCFRKAVRPPSCLPATLEWVATNHVRGHDDLDTVSTPWSEADPSEWFPPAHADLSADSGTTMTSVVPSFSTRPTMSRYSLLEEASRVLSEIRSRKITASGNYLYAESREGILEEDPHYDLHRTRQLEGHVEDYLSLWSEDYRPFTQALPLTNVLWCTGGVHQATLLGYAVTHGDPGNWRRVVFHEHGHHMERVVPEIGVFTNHLVRRKTGGPKSRMLVPVYGGVAMPVTDGSKDWIVPYAGKWYDRLHPSLPVGTEVVSVYSEYFRSPEALLRLMLFDPFMVKFMSFVFMGGPVAAIAASVNRKNTEALQSLKQRQMHQRELVERQARKGTEKARSPGGSGSRGGGGGGGYTPKDRSKSFGV